MRILFAILSLLIVSLAPSTTKVEPADLIFINGNVYTVNDKQPHAEAVAVKMDRIVFVGSNADAKKYQGANTRILDLRGAKGLPGRTDPPPHLDRAPFRAFPP